MIKTLYKVPVNEALVLAVGIYNMLGMHNRKPLHFSYSCMIVSTKPPSFIIYELYGGGLLHQQVNIHMIYIPSAIRH